MKTIRNTLKKAIGLSAIVCLSVIFVHAQNQPAEPKLKVDDLAPEFKVKKWIKGEPFKMEKGKVYVLEFWATWCGPCKLAMPHLSELAKKYEEVAFIGVDASEKSDNADPVQRFVDVSNGMIAYNIVFDTPRGFMYKNWLQAAGKKGIPASFVVTADGRIGWIGHPLMGLEEAVELAINNNLTTQTAAAIDEKWAKKHIKGKEADEALKTALTEKRIDDALRFNDAVLENWPYQIQIAPGKKYALLTAKDPKAARAYGEELLRTHAYAPGVLKCIAYTIFEGSDARVLGEIKVKITGDPDYELARKLLTQALKCSEPDWKTKEFMKRLQDEQ